MTMPLRGVVERGEKKEAAAVVLLEGKIEECVEVASACDLFGVSSSIIVRYDGNVVAGCVLR